MEQHQSEQHLCNCKPVKGPSKSEANKSEVNDMYREVVILDLVKQKHQVHQNLGNPFPKKLARVVKKYWKFHLEE